MKKIVILFFIGWVTLVYGQKNKESTFDIEDFSKKMEVAEWLYKYDMVAWWTTDSVMTQDKKEIERLGREWFCFEQDNSWHAVYGKYEDNQFDLIFHFKVDDKGLITRTNEVVDTTLLHRYSRVLQTANKQLISLQDTVNVIFNQYIKENDDKTFSVWIFPAFQLNNVAVYGGEFIYTIDQTGNQILKDNGYFQGQFRGFTVDTPREIWLGYGEIEKPTLGAIFFAWYYKSYFTKIGIDNSRSTSILFKSDNNWNWVHIEKEPEKK